MTAQRRGIHSLVAVSMLIGFTITMAGMLFYVLDDHAGIAVSNSACTLHNVSLHSTGNTGAYFVASLHNIGHDTVTSVNFTIVVGDGGGKDHKFSTGPMELASGQTWDEKRSIPVPVSSGGDYLVYALAQTDSGSAVQCSAVHHRT